MSDNISRIDEINQEIKALQYRLRVLSALPLKQGASLITYREALPDMIDMLSAERDALEKAADREREGGNDVLRTDS